MGKSMTTPPSTPTTLANTSLNTQYTEHRTPTPNSRQHPTAGCECFSNNTITVFYCIMIPPPPPPWTLSYFKSFIKLLFAVTLHHPSFCYSSYFFKHLCSTFWNILNYIFKFSLGICLSKLTPSFFFFFRVNLWLNCHQRWFSELPSPKPFSLRVIFVIHVRGADLITQVITTDKEPPAPPGIHFNQTSEKWNPRTYFLSKILY